MLEILLACGLFFSLLFCALVCSYCRWDQLFKVGLGTLALGFVMSCLAGIAYHVELAKTTVCRQQRAGGWWWSPTRLHGCLTAREALRVLPWFWAGAAGFCLVILGAVWTILAISVMKE